MELQNLSPLGEHDSKVSLFFLLTKKHSLKASSVDAPLPSTPITSYHLSLTPTMDTHLMLVSNAKEQTWKVRLVELLRAKLIHTQLFTSSTSCTLSPPLQIQTKIAPATTTRQEN